MDDAKKGNDIIPMGYGDFLRTLKARIQTAKTKAALSVNREMILLYWEIGRDILERQAHLGWGTKVIDQLSKDLRHAFAEVKGFSVRNLKYMRTFAEEFPDHAIVQQPVAQIPWGHIVRLLDKVKVPEKRLWYIQKTIENGWSRTVLVHQIETDLYGRQATPEKTTNFAAALSLPQSDLVQQTIKDAYIFDFLSLGKEAHERDLERGLIDRIRDFMLELGAGFAFMGSQYHLEVGGQDFYIDLLFYHHRLRCLVALDLKMGDFKPEYTGKMNFYLSALDDLVRHPNDQPSVGMVLCKGKNRTVTEYALRDMSKPIGVSAYRLTETLPRELAESLPAPEALERLLSDDKGAA